MGGTNNRANPGIYMEGSTGNDNSSIWAKYNLTLGCDSTDGIAGRQVAFSNGGDQIAAFSIDGLVFGSDSAAANALDDYEEGTWTPSVPGTSPGFHQQVGTYVKIGNLVHCDMWLQASGTTTSTAELYTTLPFTASSVNASRPTTGVARTYNLGNWGTNDTAFGWVAGSSSSLAFMWTNAGANPGAITGAVWQNGAEIHASISYRTGS